MFKFARIIALTGAAALLLVGGMAVPVTTATTEAGAMVATAAASAYDQQKTPAECPLTLSEPDLFACSETYHVQAAPGDGAGVFADLPTSDTGGQTNIEFPRDGDYFSITPGQLTFQHHGLPRYVGEDGVLTLTLRTQYGMGTGATSWEVWPTPSFGVATWSDTAGFVYRPTSVGTDTFALRVCRETTDEVQTYVAFTQCYYQPLRFTITAL